MSAWKHPATIIASLALFVALGGGTALAGGLNGLISGKKIVNHSIAENKLTSRGFWTRLVLRRLSGDAQCRSVSPTRQPHPPV